MSAIEIKNLSKTFGKFTAISDINLTVERGEIFGFIGPNGAGKSTTIKALLNFIYPSAGNASILGMDCISQSAEIKKVTSYVPSEVRYYGGVKVSTLLNYAESFHPKADKQKTQQLCELFEVDLDKKMKELSLGNKKKIAIVQALLYSPELIILDEPTNGLDPLMQSKLLDCLKEVNQQGTTIFLSSHNLSEVQHFCQRVAIIKKGKILDVKTINDNVDIIYKIRIVSRSDLHSLENLVGTKKYEKEGNNYRIEYGGDINELIKLLSQYSIDDMEFARLGIEDTFMNYYK